MMLNEVPQGAVLVGIDGSGESYRALTWAVMEARRRGCPLHVMHVLDDTVWVEPDHSVARRSLVNVVDEALERVHRQAPDLTVTSSSPIGRPPAVLADAARSAVIVAVGSHGLGSAGEAVLGSVATRLIAKAPCPVAVLRESTSLAAASDGPVVVGVSNEESSAPALRVAFEQAQSRHVPVIAVRAWLTTAATVVDHHALQGMAADAALTLESDLLRRDIADVAQRHPQVEFTTHVVHGGTAEALVRYGVDASLLVVGSRGRREIGGAVLGSVSQRVIRTATCPVLVVRPDGVLATPAHADAHRREEVPSPPSVV